MDDSMLGKLLSELKNFSQHAEHIFIACVFSVVNALVRPPQASFGRYVLEFVISVIVASFVGYVCTTADLSKSLTHTLVAISALLARDSLEFIIGFGGYVKGKRKNVYERILNRLTDPLDNDINREGDNNNGKEKNK